MNRKEHLTPEGLQHLTKYDVYPELEETSKSVSTQRADPLSNTNTQPLKRCGPNG